MINYNNINIKSSLEEFLKIEYTDGLKNEFNTMDALINRIAKDQLTGKYKTKQIALGVTDNIRMLGNGNDMYELGVGDYTNAVDTVEARFDTTKLMGIFAITDETIVKGTTDGSIFDVLKDSLDRMNMSLKHKSNTYTYGSHTGKIGVINSDVDAHAKTETTSPFYNKADYVCFKMSNTLSVLQGTGVAFCDLSSGTPVIVAQGKVWQKYNNKADGNVEYVKVIVDQYADGKSITDLVKGLYIYSRQLKKDTIVPEYTGLEDIVITQDNTLFGVDRSIYQQLNCVVTDLEGGLLTESVLRDMADTIELSCSDDSSIKLVASNHKVISTVEKSLYQYKQYNIDTAGESAQLGRKDIKFDTYSLFKDKFSRDQNVYLLDTDKIGELIRKDFGWITSGNQSQVLERRDGSEVYEGIMTKYADMYIDSWKCHAAFVNAAETIA